MRAPSSRLRRAALSIATAAASVAALMTFTVSGPAQASSRHVAGSVINFGLTQLGDPYQWGATGPSSWDCSGFTQAAYKAAGITLPRVSRDQYNAGQRIPRGSWRNGDLVFYASDTSRPSTIHHVAIYIGGGRILHAPRTGEVVRIREMWTRGLMYYAVRPDGSSAKLMRMYRGDEGNDIKALQRRLRANGFDVSVTGYYGSGTSAAVASVRDRAGLGGRGSVVGYRVWNYLNAHGTQTSVS